ncbi:hypothetical protein EGW08_006633 [Elysia chlorotica]|uniref:LYR motif-containing protein 9 n=1 Tax=Elysia chlorotica TaxID=188477 RepID=A0A433TVK7_ELYCH|nr:hypothetical protein EGW08_006633 [Elysia chlorotica]
MIKSPASLYKHLLRCVQRLPPETQDHYKHHVRQGFKSHSDEDDPERIKQITERAMQDAEWVILKYSEKEKK